jgi:nitronate monooxygenase
MFSFSDLKIPVIQAPMAGGVCTPALVAAVARAGGVGSFGFAYSTPQKIAEDLIAARALISSRSSAGNGGNGGNVSPSRQARSGAINANFFVFKPVALPRSDVQQAAMQALQSLSVGKDVFTTPPEIPSAPFYPDLHEQIAPVWEHKPDILTFHFGIPDASIVDQAHALGIAVGMTATCVTEAQAIEAAGADFIVAQGIEAGGHRGIFDIHDVDEELSTLDLTRTLLKHVSVPVVAAGAIMDGSDICAALNAGASAAQMGTAFLCCEESGATPAHKDFLINEGQRGSVITKGFSGRPARGIRNAFIDHMQDQTVLPFPIQNTFTGGMRKWATQTNNGEYQSLWAGTQYHRVRTMPVDQLMQTLVKEMCHPDQGYDA